MRKESLPHVSVCHLLRSDIRWVSAGFTHTHQDSVSHGWIQLSIYTNLIKYCIGPLLTDLHFHNFARYNEFCFIDTYSMNAILWKELNPELASPQRWHNSNGVNGSVCINPCKNNEQQSVKCNPTTLHSRQTDGGFSNRYNGRSFFFLLPTIGMIQYVFIALIWTRKLAEPPSWIFFPWLSGLHIFVNWWRYLSSRLHDFTLFTKIKIPILKRD